MAVSSPPSGPAGQDHAGDSDPLPVDCRPVRPPGRFVQWIRRAGRRPAGAASSRRRPAASAWRSRALLTGQRSAGVYI